MKPDGIRPNALTTNSESLTRLEGGITKANNAFGIFKDNIGNSVYRVDYQNNDADNIYDEEEVRNSEGKLVSYTKRSHSEMNSNNPKNINYYKKYEYDANENLVRITEIQCDYKGNIITTKDIPVDTEPSLVGHVHIGTPVDGEWGDKSLIDKFKQWGAKIIGNW